MRTTSIRLFPKKPLYGFCFLLTLTITLNSCQKIVYIDLNTTDPKVVVEANITDHAGPYLVKLSRCMNYYDPNIFPAITQADVSISDNLGNQENLLQIAPGIFQTASLQAVPERTYTLKINCLGKIFESTSRMPAKVPIDSVSITLAPKPPGRDHPPAYHVVVYYKDPPGLGNYYRLYVTSNDTAESNHPKYLLASDKLSDGDIMSISHNANVTSGDSLFLKLETIDKGAYDYFNTVRLVVGNNNFFSSAPPSNPVSNISNGALGYFSAYAFEEKIFVIP